MYVKTDEAQNQFVRSGEKLGKAIKIMIVDDEPKIFKGLSILIGKMGTPASTIFCADEAHTALNWVSEFNPDVVIADICMPGMDGFTLIDKIRELSDCTHFIILSGYSDFEYARTAIQKRTMDYLMKPVDEIALQKLLLQVEFELEQDRISYCNREINKFRDCLLYGVPIESLLADGHCESLFPYPFFMVTVCRSAEPVPENMLENLKGSLYTISSESFFFIHPNHRLVTILSNLPDDLSSDQKQARSERLCETAASHGLESFIIGMSNPSSSIYQLNKLYHYAIRDSYISQYLFAKSASERKVISDCLDVFFGKLEYIFDTGSFTRINENLFAMTRRLSPMFQNSNEWNNLYSVFKLSLKDSLISPEGLSQEGTSFSEIDWEYHCGANDPEKITNAIAKMLSTAYASHLCQSSDVTMTKSAKEMTDYIHSHYMKDISLVDVAKTVHLHPKYASALFRKSTGMTFIQYLNDYRISKAIEIMSVQPDITHDAIALMVGYENQRNYYKVFRKKCDCTPGEFRKRFINHINN